MATPKPERRQPPQPDPFFVRMPTDGPIELPTGILKREGSFQDYLDDLRGRR